MNEEILQNLNQRLDVAVERGKQFLEDEDVQQRIEDAKLIAEDTVRKHPVKSVLIGLAVGFLIGKALTGDDD